MKAWPGNTESCRFADDVLHQCRRRDGRIIVGDEPCWFECESQIAELAAELAAAE